MVKIELDEKIKEAQNILKDLTVKKKKIAELVELKKKIKEIKEEDTLFNRLKRKLTGADKFD